MLDFLLFLNSRARLIKMIRKKILITGASGFVGFHVCKTYLAGGYHVHLLVRDSAQTSHLKLYCKDAVLHVCPQTSEGFVDLLTEIKPELVIHLASTFISEHSTSDIDSLISSNVEFGCRLVDAMAKCGVKNFINTGTSWQHFMDRDFLPVNLYAATKQAFESLLLFYADAVQMNIITLSLFDTYGPMDTRGKLISFLLDAAKSGEKISMTKGEQLLDIVHVSDVAEAFLLAGQKMIGNELRGMKKFGLSSGERITVKRLVSIVEEAANRPINVNWGGRNYKRREVFHPWVSFNRLEGWAPTVTIQKGIKSLV